MTSYIALRRAVTRRKTTQIEQRIAEYRSEIDDHRAQHDRWSQRNAEARALRDAEPIILCQAPHPMGGKCVAEMRQGDYRCHLCATPNPEYVPRAVEFVLYGEA